MLTLSFLYLMIKTVYNDEQINVRILRQSQYYGSLKKSSLFWGVRSFYISELPLTGMDSVSKFKVIEYWI